MLINSLCVSMIAYHLGLGLKSKTSYKLKLKCSLCEIDRVNLFYY